MIDGFQKETILRKVIEVTRGILDVTEVKQNIVNELGRAFKADRCYFRFYDKVQDKFSPPDVEYLASPEVKSLLHVEPNQEGLKYFSSELKKRSKGFYPVIANEDFTKNTPLETYMKSSEIVADYAMPIMDIEEGFTWLVLHYAKEDPCFDDDCKRLLEIIAFQVDTILNQLRLYATTKKQAEREQILRGVVNKIRASLDIEKIKHELVFELGNLMKADRVAFADYNFSEGNYHVLPGNEYRSSSNVKSFIGYNFAETPGFIDAIRKIHIMGKDIIFDDLDKYLEENNLKSTGIENFYRDMGFLSSMAINIFYKGVFYGDLVITFATKKNIDKEDIKFVKNLVDQVGIALYQAELFEKEKHTKEMEIILRETVKVIRSTLDADKIKKYFLETVCNYFNADRCLFDTYDKEINKFLPFDMEILKTDGVKSLIGASVENDFPEFASKLKNKKRNIIIKDVKKTLSRKNLSHYKAIQTLHNSDAKSDYGFIVQYQNDILGILILHYVQNKRVLTHEELEFLKILRDQAGIALYQAELYSKIEKNERYTRTVLENITDAIITIDKKFIIKSCNQAVEKLWGYKLTECIDKPLRILLNYDCSNNNPKYCLNKKDVYGIRKDYTEFPVEISLSDIITDNQKNILLVVRDITERKKVEQMKNEFVSTVSHELRTPLTSIRGSLGLILTGKLGELPDKIKGLLDIANNNCLRLINLINDILDIEKIEAGKMDFNMDITDIVPLINQAIQLNTQYAQKFNVSIEFENNIGQALVKVDNDRLLQVLTNLLSNAIKFSLPLSSVKISVDKNDTNSIRVSILNYGTEISAEFKARIFQKFAQADSSDARQKGGTGLGLSISKAIIEKMQGHIGFISENKKTNFYFDLPEFIEEKPFIRNRIDKSKPNILICEDDKDIASLLNMLLEQENYYADISYNARQTKQLLNERDYDILLLDLILPDEDGISLIKEIRENMNTKDLPIIVVSVKAKEGAKELDGHFAVFDWIDKPIQKDKLIDALNRALIEKFDVRPKMLHVEDDEDVRKITQAILGNDIYISQASTLKEARDLLVLDNFDILLLDIELPDGNGLELLDLLNKNPEAQNIITVIFSAHNVSDNIAKQVDAVLLKSNTSNNDLLKIVNMIKAKKNVINEKIYNSINKKN